MQRDKVVRKRIIQDARQHFVDLKGNIRAFSICLQRRHDERMDFAVLLFNGRHRL